MKQILFTLFTCITITAYSQVGIGTVTPDASSILELDSTTQGMLTPRMLESERDAIASPATGLLIYQTDNTSGFYYYNGAAWVPFGGADNDWTVTGNDMYNANSGNVGVGNTAPSTKFHITGTTVPANPGGLTTLYSNDFSTGGVTSVAAGANDCAASPNIWHIDTFSTFASCTTCTNERAYIRYSTSCVQDQTLVEGVFSPTTTSIDISFNYGYNDGGATDSFVVTLFNETTTSVTATLLNLNADALDTSYSGTHTVTAGDNYSLRFQYIGDNEYGATVDDILITENQVAASGSYVFRLEDGQQGVDKVLASDANGNATWQNIGANPSLSDKDWLGPGVSDNSGFVYHAGTASVGTTAIDTGLHFQVQDGTSASGTQVGLGSIEVIEDLVAEFTFNYGILPALDDFTAIGSAANRWQDLYLVNAPTVSSDMTLKNNVKELKHGLNTIMKLKTLSYQWKNNTIGDKTIARDEKETHIGFSAQQLLELIPEVVKTHSWRILDEATPETYTRVKHDKLGVRYTEIIPVTVKAIQEQQEQIEDLKSEVSELKKLINKLISEKE
ncbi:MAG: tail fiber domain-containing protein [Flavobacteriaceae bacterium]